jgi:hypothetical protein
MQLPNASQSAPEQCHMHALRGVQLPWRNSRQLLRLELFLICVAHDVSCCAEMHDSTLCRCVCINWYLMGGGPSAMDVAASYDGAGKVVVITGANSGIGNSPTHLTRAGLNFCKAKRRRGFWRLGAVRAHTLSSETVNPYCFDVIIRHRCHVRARQAARRRRSQGNSGCGPRREAECYGTCAARAPALSCNLALQL